MILDAVKYDLYLDNIRFRSEVTMEKNGIVKLTIFFSCHTMVKALLNYCG